MKHESKKLLDIPSSWNFTTKITGELWIVNADSTQMLHLL